MKTLEQILKSRPVFLDDWAGCKASDILSDFRVPEIKGLKILFATYTYRNYSGYAFVLFSKNGKLYEVNGSHCSCYGLEGEWEPEKASLKELENRVKNGSICEEESTEKLAKFLGVKLDHKNVL